MGVDAEPAVAHLNIRDHILQSWERIVVRREVGKDNKGKKNIFCLGFIPCV